MDKPTGKVVSDRRRRLLKVGGIIAALAIILAGVALFTAPRLTEHLFRKQLEDIQDRVGLTFDVASVETTGLDGIVLRQFEVSLPDGGEKIGTIEEIRISIALLQAARGRAGISRVEMEGVEFAIHRRADGTSAVDDFLSRDDAEPAEDVDYDPSVDTSGLNERVQRLLRHFGGAYPHIVVTDASLELTHHEDAAPWPMRRIWTQSFVLEGDPRVAPFESVIEIDPVNTADRQLPERVELSGTLRIPAENSTISLDFEPRIRVANLPQFPFIEASTGGFAIDENFTIRLTSPTIDSRLSTEAMPLASADRVAIQFDGWPRSRSDVTLLELEVDGPELLLQYNEFGASNVGELLMIARQPAAAGVVDHARSTTRAIAAESLEDDDESPDQAQDEGTPRTLRERLEELPIRHLLTNLVPQQTTLRGFRLIVDDARHHETLIGPAEHLEVHGELIDLRHRPIQGHIDGTMQFQIEAGDEIGRVDLDVAIPYRRGDWNAKVELDNIQLAHLAQLGGSRVASRLHGGQISANIDVSNNGGERQITSFDGFFAGDSIRVHFPSFAEAPIEVDNTSLQLRGYYDPTEPVPAPLLINSGYSVPGEDEQDGTDDLLGLDEEEESDDDLRPPMRGAFVIESAVARLGQVRADFNMAIRGIEGSRLPNRVYLGVELDSTPLQDIIDAVPVAMRGPLDGIEMVGELTWNFRLEVPLHHASDMRWDADVDLSRNFAVTRLPDAVDVYKLLGEFEHTITDEWTGRRGYRERDFIYERTVTIPAMRPTPATWLMENSPLELDRIDRIRRQRGWPEVPTYDSRLGMSMQLLDSPEYWLTSHALRQAAPVPWNDPPLQTSRPFWAGWGGVDDGLANDDHILRYSEPAPLGYNQRTVRLDAERYGDYVFVPLHHISPFVIRAIMTTEDTGFFTHSGFNFLAIRQSVQANINNRRFVRGASTISMQLAKNLFLDRSRILSRKLQEVTLVWLMESVADIPKERLLEIYLNIIEFGPGVYGIHDASIHYFGKRPDELTIAEAAWLVSIVPSPKRHHSYYERGAITPSWFRRMSRYIRAMYHRDRITEEQMEEALAEIPEFYIPEDGEPILRRYAAAEVEIVEDDADEEAASEPEATERRPRRFILFD